MTVLRTLIGESHAYVTPFKPTALIPRSDVQTAIEYIRGLVTGIVESATAPASPTPGMLWWDLTSETLNAYVASVGGWIDLTSALGGSSVTITESATAPSASAGALWYDTGSETLNVYIAALGSWLDVSTAGGGSSLTESATPPAGPRAGDKWWNTVNETLSVWVPSIGWLDVSSAGAGAIYTEGATPPATPTLGDTWLDTTTLTFAKFTTQGWVGL